VTRSPHRRAAALLAGAVLGAALLLSGCSAGQIAETAKKEPSVQGVNAEASVDDGSVAVRDVMVAYPGPEGYEGGEDAPLEVRIFNDTRSEVSVTVRTGAAGTDPEALVRAGSVELVGEETPASGADESPAGDGAAPAKLAIPADGYSVLTRDSGTYLRLLDLAGPLTAGLAVPLVFEFDNGATIQVNAPVAMPLTPVPRGTAEEEEPAEGH
jgi:hypothetical protein